MSLLSEVGAHSHTVCQWSHQLGRNHNRHHLPRCVSMYILNSSLSVYQLWVIISIPILVECQTDICLDTLADSYNTSLVRHPQSGQEYRKCVLSYLVCTWAIEIGSSSYVLAFISWQRYLLWLQVMSLHSKTRIKAWHFFAITGSIFIKGFNYKQKSS